MNTFIKVASVGSILKDSPLACFVDDAKCDHGFA